MAWVVGHAKAKSSSIKTLNNGDIVLKNHIVFALLGYFIGLIFLFFLGLGFYFGWESNPDDTWVSYIFPVVIMLLLLYGFVYITFYYYNHRVIYNTTSITSYDAWGRNKSMKWSDIKDAEFNANMQDIRIYSKQGYRIVMSAYLYGMDDFRNEFFKHHPYLLQRIIK